MKRVIFIFAIVLCGAVQSQTYDTISGKDGILPHYYYPDGWYDTCNVFFETRNTPENMPNRPEYWGSFMIGPDGVLTTYPGDPDRPAYCTVYEHYVDGPVAFTGVAVMIIKLPDTLDGPVVYDTVFPDTVLILCPDTSGELSVVASVSTQWDTAARKVWKFPIHVDSAVYGFRYVYLYELKFDHPVVVDSLYYLFGTGANMIVTLKNLNPLFLYWQSHPYGHAVIYIQNYVQHYPGEYYTPCNPYRRNSYWAEMDNGKLEMYEARDEGSMVDWWGPYLLMIDSCTIEVGTADSAMGTAGPTRSMSKWVTQTITATPEYGYRFSHWDDGNTENPRDIYLTQDTHFVAYFEPHPRHTLHTRCEPEGKGMVVGDGLYWYGDTAMMYAKPVAPYIFRRWNDDNTENPRRIAIEQDTAFVAYFVRQQVDIDTVADADILFTLTPNPTTGRVTVEIHLPQSQADMGEPLITIRDVAGHEVLRRVVPAAQAAVEIGLSHLPAGTYFVTLSTAKCTATRRLVVE